MSWPPKLNTIVQIDCNNQIYIGKVILIHDLTNGAIIKLINNKNYVDFTLKNDYNITNKGLFLLTPSNKWVYYHNDTNKISNSEAKNQVLESFAKFKGGNDENMPKSMTKSIYDDSILIKSINETESDLSVLFSDEDMICNTVTNCFDTTGYNIEKINNELKNDIINENDVGIATSKLLSYDNIINNKRDEIGEADKIISWLDTKLSEYGIKLFMKAHNGYIHIMKESCEKKQDVITQELIPNLRFFEWQYNKPIDYGTLKNVLFRNNYQKKIKRDMEQLDEAKKILGIEYLIGFQPQPQYQLWCTLRLILCWVSNTLLSNNIKKIKLLINLYRARPNLEYNQEHGTLSSIIVYPRYGINSAKNVMKILGEYFFYSKRIAWKNNSPTYFIKVDELIHYTNGINDLKLYFRNVLSESKDCMKNDVFDNNYTKIITSKDFFDMKKD